VLPAAAGNATRTVGSFATTNLEFTYEGISSTVHTQSIDNGFDEKMPFAIGDGYGDEFGYASSQHYPRGHFRAFKTMFRF